MPTVVLDQSRFLQSSSGNGNARASSPEHPGEALVAKCTPRPLHRGRRRVSEPIWLRLRHIGEHAESGEERFTVEWNRNDDIVWYDILAFSRPRQMLAKLGYPLSPLL